jgi:hypothetical protein
MRMHAIVPNSLAATPLSTLYGRHSPRIAGAGDGQSMRRRRRRSWRWPVAARRRLLLAGPPGARQTMVAAALSGELALPLIVIQLGALVAAHASKSERELRQVLDAIACLRGVYFIDVLDVPAPRNAAANDAAPAHSMLDRSAPRREQVIAAACTANDTAGRSASRCR